MVYFVLIGVLLGVIIGPSIWVKAVVARYGEPADRYPGTGGELARHLLDQLGLSDVAVESTEAGDHYDAVAKAVRLLPAHHDGRSLSAVTIAAHEVGHAIQDATGYGPMRWRRRLDRVVGPLQQLGAGVLMLSPVLGVITRAPSVTLLMIAGGLLSLGTAVVVRIATLPVEFDASFGRALPILTAGGYLKPGDAPHARKLLRAAALTYVSQALMSLLNVGRWLALLRR